MLDPTAGIVARSPVCRLSSQGNVGHDGIPTAMASTHNAVSLPTEPKGSWLAHCDDHEAVRIIF